MKTIYDAIEYCATYQACVGNLPKYIPVSANEYANILENSCMDRRLHSTAAGVIHSIFVNGANIPFRIITDGEI